MHAHARTYTVPTHGNPLNTEQSASHTDSPHTLSHLCKYTSPAMLDKRTLVKAISLNCFHDGGESALSCLVGRGGAVRYTGDHRKSIASELEKGHSCDSGPCRSARKRFSRLPSSSTSLNLTATPSRSLLCPMKTSVDQSTKMKVPREVPSITQSYSRIAYFQKGMYNQHFTMQCGITCTQSLHYSLDCS